MIHLDRNHPLDKQNIITTDHHKILSWYTDDFLPDQPTPQPPPSPPPTAHEKEAPPLILQREEEEEDEVHPSRQSTPLSELSPPPDDPEVTVHDSSQASSPTAPPDADNKPPNVPSPRPSSPNRATPSIESPATPSATAFPTSPNQKSDPKVVSILELNSELLKICIDLQSRGVAGTEQKFQQYSQRLQSNLTWLAAAADHSRNHLNMLLPTMDPPPPIDFTSTERIRHLYAELPTIFAKEIARRNQITTIPPLPQHISAPNTPLKRERSDEPPVDITAKRRNTGDSKSPSAMMPPPSSIPSISSTHFSLPMSNGPSVATVPAPSSPQLSEAQMASINPGVMNTTEAQLAATSRDRARQAQIRAAHAHQQQVARQMSPPSLPPQQQMHASNINPNMNMNMNVNAAAGPSNSSNMPSLNGVPDATMRQIYNVMRTPDHPFMRYMHRTVPNFQALPMELQIQKMMVAQNALQTRQQHDQQQQQNQMPSHSQSQRPGTAGTNSMNPMSGMPMQNNAGGMSGGQFPGSTNGQASPIPPQSPMMHQGQQNPMFTLSGNPGQSNAGNTGIDPRVMMSGGGGVNMNNLTPHQRQQLMLMQQQQQQPSRFGGNNAPPNSSMMSMNPMTMNLNPQQAAAFAAQHQQRMAHAGSPTHASPGIDGGQGFPILRSNSTIPGIARSTRSPSESAPSPMTPRGPPARGSSLGQEDYQRMMMQQQQAQAQVARGMSSAPSPVYQQQQHGQWSQSQSQNQNQNQGQGQQTMQIGMGMGQQGTYGMSPPGSASGHYGSVNGGGGGGGGGSSAPSPSNSQSQNWPQGQGNYPFAPSPGAGGGVHHSDHMQVRHMSATPGPQQMSSQNMNSPTMPSLAEQPIPHDFDPFIWS